MPQRERYQASGYDVLGQAVTQALLASLATLENH